MIQKQKLTVSSLNISEGQMKTNEQRALEAVKRVKDTIEKDIVDPTSDIGFLVRHTINVLRIQLNLDDVHVAAIYSLCKAVATFACAESATSVLGVVSDKIAQMEKERKAQGN